MGNSLTPSGIEPATFRFVAPHLNHCATAVPGKPKQLSLFVEKECPNDLLTYLLSYLFTYLLTCLLAYYLLTPWCRVLLEQLTGLQLVKKFPAIHGTRRFITALTSVRHLSLSWASPIQSIYPHPTSWRSILIYPPIYAQVSPVVSFPQVSPPKSCTRLSPPTYALHAPIIPLSVAQVVPKYQSRSEALSVNISYLNVTDNY